MSSKNTNNQETGKVHAPAFGKMMTGLMHDLTITDGAKVLFAHMYWRYGSNRDNHESQKSMANYLGVTETTIRKRLEELEANDWIITIYQEPDDKHQYQRCQYHIFETQADCRIFRAECNLTPDATLKTKPEARQRKSRKGAGNPAPKIPGHVNSGSHGENDENHVNSGSPNRVNSGSLDLDVVNLDSSKDSAAKEAANGNAVASVKEADTNVEPAFIAAWIKALPSAPIEAVSPYQNKNYRKIARALHKDGYTPEQLSAYVTEQLAQTWRTEKFIKFATVCAALPSWVKTRHAAPTDTRLEDHPYYSRRFEREERS